MLLGGFIFYGVMYFRYRNSNARHVYENETKKQVLNMVESDTLVEHKKRLSNSSMEGANYKKLDGETISKNSDLGNKINNSIKK